MSRRTILSESEELVNKLLAGLDDSLSVEEQAVALLYSDKILRTASDIINMMVAQKVGVPEGETIH